MNIITLLTTPSLGMYFALACMMLWLRNSMRDWWKWSYRTWLRNCIAITLILIGSILIDNKLTPIVQSGFQVFMSIQACLIQHYNQTYLFFRTSRYGTPLLFTGLGVLIAAILLSLLRCLQLGLTALFAVLFTQSVRTL